MKLTKLRKLKLLKDLGAPFTIDLKYWRVLRKRFRDHQYRSARRNIGFTLSFLEWLWIWKLSGKWPLRGIYKHNYQMCRYGDKGPYAKGNVYIDTQENNLKHRYDPKLPPGSYE